MATPNKKAMTLLSSDLKGLVSFDTKQTLPAMDITSSSYNEGMSLYLQNLKVNKIDEEYNAAIRAFETQLEEQELAAKLQATLASETLSNAAVEAQPGLGAGAAAVAAEGRASALEASHAEIETTLSETYQKGIQNISEQHQSELEAALGKYNAETDTFEGLTEYISMQDKTTEALMKVLAMTINSQADTLSDTGKYGYTTILREAGIIESDVNGTVTLTSAGQEKIDQLVNSVNADELNPILGNRTLLSAVAEQMAIADYTIDGISTWDNVGATKQTEILKEYQSWIYNNMDNLRVSSWELYEKAGEGYVLDIDAELPSLNSSGLYHEGVDAESGISIEYFTLEDAEAKTENQERLDTIKTDIMSGKIGNGSYITFADGKANKNDKFYYVYNGYIYSTEYTMENPPKQISVATASVYSFGKYIGTGKNKGKQDAWVKEIIDSARAGRIPDGTYVNMNFGTGEGAYYQYINGYFVKVDRANVVWKAGDTDYSDTYTPEDRSHATNVIEAGNFWSSGAFKETAAVDKYLDW